jgi:hypothetical protein
MNSFLNERIVIKNHKKFNGYKAIITKEKFNQNKLTLQTDIQLDKFSFLSIDLSQIDHIKQFKGTITQYQTKDGKTITNNLSGSQTYNLKIIGQFDIYEKLYLK